MEEENLSVLTTRPSRAQRQRQEKPASALGVELLERRRANGLDLWTGLPLTGKDAEEWLRHEAEREADSDQRALRALYCTEDEEEPEEEDDDDDV